MTGRLMDNLTILDWPSDLCAGYHSSPPLPPIPVLSMSSVPWKGVPNLILTEIIYVDTSTHNCVYTELFTLSETL